MALPDRRAPQLAPGYSYMPRSAFPVGLAWSLCPQNNSIRICFVYNTVVLGKDVQTVSYPGEDHGFGFFGNERPAALKVFRDVDDFSRRRATPLRRWSQSHSGLCCSFCSLRDLNRITTGISRS